MTGIAMQLWRDADPAVRSRPGMALGRVEVAGDWVARAADLYDRGTRAVRVEAPVHLCGPGSAGALALVRELTAHGVDVEWAAVCRPGCDDGRLFGHLFPPARVDCGGDGAAADEILGTWRQQFFPAKCVFRCGPGFLEVRDRRWRSLEMYTIDDPDWMRAVSAMVEGAPPAAVPAEAREAFADARLTMERDGALWWLPVRIRRWPFPPLLV